MAREPTRKGRCHAWPSSAGGGRTRGARVYLDQMRLVMRLTAYGLTDEQAWATPTASQLSVGGLIKHVASVERSWMNTVLAGRSNGDRG